MYLQKKYKIIFFLGGVKWHQQKLDKKNITTQALGEEGGATTDSIFDAAKEKDVQPKYTTMAVENMELDFKYDVDVIIDGMIYRKLTVDDAISKNIKKGKGIYYNIDDIDYLNNKESIISLLENTIKDILVTLKIDNNKSILICGLGNDFVTPDALGPLTVNKVEVNRHLDNVNKYTISAICPGVMGKTGMESSEIVKAIVDDFHPDLVIVVDALACSNPKRMCHSIQLSTAGINPGSGVGNKRKEISKSSIGVDVLAIGIPTVSDIDCFVEMENDFFVTPKDIDLAMDVLSSIIAEGINMALYE